MNDKEIKLLRQIEKEALNHLDKEGFVPYQITVSDKQWKVYKDILKQGRRATVNFNGIKWQINVQCCSKTVITVYEKGTRGAMV
jgi:hypothetical protein